MLIGRLFLSRLQMLPIGNPIWTPQKDEDMSSQDF